MDKGRDRFHPYPWQDSGNVRTKLWRWRWLAGRWGRSQSRCRCRWWRWAWAHCPRRPRPSHKSPPAAHPPRSQPGSPSGSQTNSISGLQTVEGNLFDMICITNFVTFKLSTIIKKKHSGVWFDQCPLHQRM